MKKFELLRKKALEEIEKRLKITVEQIKKDAKNKDFRYSAITRYLTDLRVMQVQQNEITAEKAEEIAIKKAQKEADKEKQKTLEKIERIEQAEDVNTITISIEWRRSYMWGYNPSVEVIASPYKRTDGTASGCGYDKESSAVAEALNKIDGLLKALYEVKESALQKDENISSHDAIEYGAGYGALPYFEGGVGMSSLEGVLNKAGYILKTQSHGKSTDFYYFERKEK